MWGSVIDTRQGSLYGVPIEDQWFIAECGECWDTFDVSGTRYDFYTENGTEMHSQYVADWKCPKCDHNNHTEKED